MSCSISAWRSYAYDSFGKLRLDRYGRTDIEQGHGDRQHDSHVANHRQLSIGSTDVVGDGDIEVFEGAGGLKSIFYVHHRRISKSLVAAVGCSTGGFF